MAEININIEEIIAAISKLTALRSAFQNSNQSPPPTVGGGGTIGELEAIGVLYKEMHAALDTLVGNTILFLKNIENSYTKSDEKIKVAFSGSGFGGGGGSSF